MRLLQSTCYMLGQTKCSYCPGTIDSESTVGHAFKIWLCKLPAPEIMLARELEAAGYGAYLKMAADLTAWARKQHIIAGSAQCYMVGPYLSAWPGLRLSPQEEARIWLTRHARTD